MAKHSIDRPLKVFLETTEFPLPILFSYDVLRDSLKTKHLLWSTSYGTFVKPDALMSLLQSLHLQIHDLSRCILIAPQLWKKKISKISSELGTGLIFLGTDDYHLVYSRMADTNPSVPQSGLLFDVTPFGEYLIAYFNPNYDFQQLLGLKKSDIYIKCIKESNFFIYVDIDGFLIIIGLSRHLGDWPIDITKLIIS